MILTITGYKGSGKTTIADYLVKEYGFTKYSFANPIKEAVKIIFDWNEDYVNGKYKEVVDVRWGVSPRQMMQFLGTEYAQYCLPDTYPDFKKRVGKSLWALRFEQWYVTNNIKNVVIDDLRFLHEVKVIKKMQEKCFIIKVCRKGMGRDDVHESEKYIEEIPQNWVIINYAGKSELYEQVDDLMTEIKHLY